jgi:hypothetical protein
MLLVSYCITIKSKAMKKYDQKDPACCVPGSECCVIADLGCC